MIILVVASRGWVFKLSPFFWPQKSVAELCIIFVYLLYWNHVTHITNELWNFRGSGKTPRKKKKKKSLTRFSVDVYSSYARSTLVWNACEQQLRAFASPPLRLRRRLCEGEKENGSTSPSSEHRTLPSCDVADVLLRSSSWEGNTSLGLPSLFTVCAVYMVAFLGIGWWPGIYSFRLVMMRDLWEISPNLRFRSIPKILLPCLRGVTNCHQLQLTGCGKIPFCKKFYF